MPTEWRVEELAREADVSVDTIRFYQKRRLLPPPRREGRLGFYGPEHLDRLARRVRGALAAPDEPLAAAVLAADAEDAEEFLSLEELARRCGIPLLLLETVATEGLLVPRDHEGEARYTAGDVAVVASGMRLVETGLPLDQLLVLARAHHTATREIAASAVAMFDAHVRQPLRDSDLADYEKAARLVEAFEVLLPAVTNLVAHHFRRVLLEVAQEHLEAVGNESEIAAANAAASRRLEGTWQG
jgi:DNA-binding transcriptional MerR regulator